MRGLCTGLVLTLALFSAAQAQQVQGLVPSGVLTLDQDRLFIGSRFGRSSLEAVEAQARALQAENRRIERDLETEEKSLTDRRAGMAPEAFRAEADAFDLRVKGIRAAQEAKARDLTAERDAARQRFLEASAPVLAQIMQEQGAVAILDRSAIVLSFDRVDVTDLAIARIDAVLLDGADGGAASEPSPPAPAPPVPAP